MSQPHLKGCGHKPHKPDQSNSNDDDLLKKILSQHPTETFTTVNSFRNFYPTIVEDVKQVINQPEEKINAATEKALKTTLDLIRKRRDERDYPPIYIEKFCASLPKNYLFNGGFVVNSLVCYCPCSHSMLKWRNQNNIALYDDDIDNCEHKKHFTSTHALMQHLESNNGYLHFATNMYLTTLHQIEN